MLTVILLLLLAGPGTVEQAKSETAEKAADSRDKVICKRFAETGSLVRGYKTCKTKWEWERERENVRQLNPTSSCGAAAEGGPC